MDEALTQVLQACRLTRELESALPHIANNPSALLAFCEQVSFAFNKAVLDLRASSSFDPSGHIFISETPQRLMEDWSLSPFALPMPTNQADLSHLGLEIQATAALSFTGGEQEHAVAQRRLGAPSTGQRSSRIRKDSEETRTVTIPAVRTGNLELPPDDGYTWRKYGQKVILGARFPRSYFRCTHKNFYGCKAKRKVQKLDADPNIYEIIYCGEHTCQTSPTPLILPSITPTSNETTLANMPVMIGASSSPSVGSWFLSSHEVGESSRAHVGPQVQQQPIRTGREGEGSVADLADAMFNSGSSSNNSMDTIFTFKTDG
ncbi:WRKY transcription factor 55-like [Phalaenopsis equestris]|uniref:WRKY transcription factor 55-like n=1 Tax=Phalaenopsis equestris TaxID=78828 RepID=UPI0009E1DECB|nr:WRKY transcription factor 55-like [Phalaenopsis equestris]